MSSMRLTLHQRVCSMVNGSAADEFRLGRATSTLGGVLAPLVRRVRLTPWCRVAG